MPALELRGGQEEAARMRVVDPLKGDPLAKRGRRDMPFFVDLLQGGADAGIVQIAVDIELERRRVVEQLEAVGLQHCLIAEFGVEPG